MNLKHRAGKKDPARRKQETEMQRDFLKPDHGEKGDKD